MSSVQGFDMVMSMVTMTKFANSKSVGRSESAIQTAGQSSIDPVAILTMSSGAINAGVVYVHTFLPGKRFLSQGRPLHLCSNVQLNDDPLRKDQSLDVGPRKLFDVLNGGAPISFSSRKVELWSLDYKKSP